MEKYWRLFEHHLTKSQLLQDPLAHRQEVYDDHMRDSNWKALVGIGSVAFFLLFQVMEFINMI